MVDPASRCDPGIEPRGWSRYCGGPSAGRYVRRFLLWGWKLNDLLTKGNSGHAKADPVAATVRQIVVAMRRAAGFGGFGRQAATASEMSRETTATFERIQSRAQVQLQFQPFD
jgi:hypothetical protein